MIQYKLFRRIAAGSALLALSTGVHAQECFTLEGRLAADSNGIVRFTYYKGRTLVTDSAKITAGRFSFAGTVEAPCEATLLRNPINGYISYEQYLLRDVQEFYLAPGVNTLTSTTGIKKGIIRNGTPQADYLVLTQLRNGFDEQMNTLREAGQKAYEAKNDSALQRIKNALQQLEKEKTESEDQFIKQHPDSHVALDMMQMRYIIRGMNVKQDAPLFSLLTQRIKQSFKGKALEAALKQAQLLTAGHVAPDFTLLDTTGQPVSLSSLRGKYVLLCFWHALSGNTRTYAQAIQLLDKQWKREDACIVSVGEAPQWEIWLSTLQHLSVPGIHLLDLNGLEEGRQSEPVKAYALTVGSFPQCYLLDKQGNILASELPFDSTLPTTIQKLIP